MSNYRYLRNIIEKIAEKGNVSKYNISETMGLARSAPELVKAVDDYVNKGKRAVRYNNYTDNLYDYLIQAENEMYHDRRITDSIEDILENQKNTYNKYAKYVRSDLRPQYKQEILEDYVKYSDEDSDRYKKASELLKQLLLNKTN